MLRARGFSLAEALIAVALAALLASLAMPGFAEQLRKARRADAVARLFELQQAEERWRANHPGYAELAALGIPAEAAGSPYRLAVVEAGESGYVALAEAIGAQSRDAACRFLRLAVAGGNTQRQSGPDASASNPPGPNERCWNR